jgi:putative transposase
MIFTFVAERCSDLPVAASCRAMKVTTSGFYEWRQRQLDPCVRVREDHRLTATIVEIHRQSRGTYGAPRVHAELRLGGGINVGRKRVARLMRDAGVEGVYRRRQRGCTKRDPNAVPIDDLINRQFTVDGPDRLWVSDITEHSTDDGKVYLAVVLDAWSRRVIGHSIADHLRAELVVDALQMAIWRRNGPTGTIVHSDHGAQGELNRSSQHLERGGVDGDDEGTAARRAAVSGTDSVTGPADGGVASGPRRVLGGDRARREDRGRGGGGAGVIPCCVQVVPSRWWREPLLARNGVGPLSVVRGARGHCGLARTEVRCARDRAAARPVAVDDLAGAAAQRVDTNVPSRVSGVARAVACGATRSPSQGREARE